MAKLSEQGLKRLIRDLHYLEKYGRCLFQKPFLRKWLFVWLPLSGTGVWRDAGGQLNAAVRLLFFADKYSLSQLEKTKIPIGVDVRSGNISVIMFMDKPDPFVLRIAHSHYILTSQRDGLNTEYCFGSAEIPFGVKFTLNGKCS